jgi:hypothetical protein
MSTDSPSILDLAYEILSSEGPLSLEDMATIARQLGYDVAGWEFQAEIEGHLLTHGESSPFIEVGYDQYGVWEEDSWQPNVSPVPYSKPELAFQTTGYGSPIPPPPPPAPVMGAPRGPLEFIFPAAISVAIVLALFLAISAGGPQRSFSRAANSIFLPSTEVAGNAQNLANAASAAGEVLQSSISLDPTWWFGNTTNQMNDETQAVARQYLSNYYNTCGPAVVAMLATFLLAQREEGGGPLTTAVVMQAAREQLGYYTPPYNSGLLTFEHLRAMLELYGFHQAYPQGEGSLIKIEELLERVRQGQPAIAGVRYSYQGDWQYRPAGGNGLYNHFVVVFAVEQVDGNEYLWVANTHPGKYLTSDSEAAPVRMSIDEFWDSWALKDGSENTNYGHAAFYEG